MLQTVEKFITYQIAKGNSPRTVGTYQQRLKMFMQFTEERELESFTPELIDRWVAAERGRGLAVVTVNGRLRDVRTFFRWCEHRGYITRSPADHLKIKRWKAVDIKAIDGDVLKTLIATAEHERDKAIIMFIASTGCRLGEAATLLRHRLHVDTREAKVDGKTGPRWVDFDRETARAMGQWLAIAPHSDWVFTGLHGRNNGDCVRPGTIYQMFRRVAKRAGVQDEIWNPHSLRHRVGQQFASNSNLELTRKKLGHADIESTIIYANQDRTMVRAATDKIKIF